jgi:hypothetical protein
MQKYTSNFNAELKIKEDKQIADKFITALNFNIKQYIRSNRLERIKVRNSCFELNNLRSKFFE